MRTVLWVGIWGAALLGMTAGSAQADILRLINVADSGSNGVNLVVGETFILAIEVTVNSGGTGNVKFVNVFLDTATPDGGQVQVTDAIFQLAWDPGADRSAAAFTTPFASGFPMELDAIPGNMSADPPLVSAPGYHLISSDSVGIAPSTTIVVEHIVVQALAAGTVNVYFENAGTTEDGRPFRRPTVSVSGAAKFVQGGHETIVLPDGTEVVVETQEGPSNVVLANGTSGNDFAVNALDIENPFVITITEPGQPPPPPPPPLPPLPPPDDNTNDNVGNVNDNTVSNTNDNQGPVDNGNTNDNQMPPDDNTNTNDNVVGGNQNDNTGDDGSVPNQPTGTMCFLGMTGWLASCFLALGLTKLGRNKRWVSRRN